MGTTPHGAVPIVFVWPFVTSEELAALVKGYSKARLEVYLRLANADPDAAWMLLEWEHRLAAALWADVARCELIIRNAIHGALQHIAQRPDWHDSLDRLGIRGRDRSRVDEAHDRIVAEGKAVTVDRIVANLSFTFWVNLTSASYDRTLWSRGLDQAFQLQRRKTVHDAMTRVKDLRNAVAHHAPLVQDLRHETSHDRLTKDLRALQYLVRWTNPTLASRLLASPAAELLTKRPSGNASKPDAGSVASRDQS
jgi:hypothetical protein